ncbi:MAG: UMP kinase, partial [Schleiferiaceae bacterium]|nr:UMP kinase [Schleiferiaceae bacterium]
MKYKRVLLKLSGESLMGTQEFGISGDQLKAYAQDIKEIVEAGVEVG